MIVKMAFQCFPSLFVLTDTMSVFFLRCDYYVLVLLYLPQEKNDSLSIVFSVKKDNDAKPVPHVHY